MKRIAAILLMLLIGCTLATAQERTNDPSGAGTGTAADVPAANAGQPSLACSVLNH
jgi:hypothetical protein